MKPLIALGIAVLMVAPALAQPQGDAKPRAVKAAAAGERDRKMANLVYELIYGVMKEMSLPESQQEAIRKLMAEHKGDMAKHALAHREALQKLGAEMQAARTAGDEELARQKREAIREIMEKGPSPRSLFLAIADELDEQQVQKFQSLAQQKRKEYEEKYGPLPQPSAARRRPESPKADPFAPVPASERIDPKKAVSELGLSPDQLQKVAAISREFQEQAQRFMELHGEEIKRLGSRLRDARASQDLEAMRRVGEELQELRTLAPDDVWGKIEAILTPEQKARFAPVAEKLREQGRRDILGRLVRGESIIPGGGKAKAGGDEGSKD